jgi:DNA invertase Pin-like site-specific DNA recombinase
MIFCSLYARVSSESQDVDLSVSAQLHDLREYAMKQGWSIFREYVDEAKSARTDDRPAFQTMISDARQASPPFHIILVHKGDRFARNIYDYVVYKTLLKRNGVRIVAIREDFGEGPIAEMIESVLAAIAQFYSANLAEETRKGHREATRRGFSHGGSPPYGFRRKEVLDGGKTRVAWEPDPITGPIVMEMFHRRVAGASYRDLQGWLQDKPSPKNNGWSIQTIETILQNEAYLGRLFYGRTSLGQKRKKHPREEWVVCENAHEALVTQEVFETVQKLRRPGRPQTAHFYLLSGLAKCAKCGAAIVGSVSWDKGTPRPRYHCSKGKRDHSCTRKAVNATEVDALVLAEVTATLKGRGLEKILRRIDGGKKKAQLERDLKALRKTHAAIAGQYSRMIDALADGGEQFTAHVGAKLDTLKEQKEELERQITEKVRALEESSFIDPGLLKSYVLSLGDLMRAASPEEKKRILADLVSVELDLEVGSGKVTFSLDLRENSSQSHKIGIRGVYPVVGVNRYSNIRRQNVLTWSRRISWA